MKITAIIFLSIVLIAGVFIFRNLGTWLLVSDPLPEKLDVIFTFAGDRKRDVYSKELANKYPNAIWVKSGANGQQYSEDLEKEGFDTSRFVRVDTCTSTWSEVNFLHEWLNSYVLRFTSDVSRPTFKVLTSNVGLVSSPYHMRRIKLMVDRRFRDKFPHVLGFTSHVPRTTSNVLTSNVKRITSNVSASNVLTSVQFGYLPVPLERYGWTKETFDKWWKIRQIRQFAKFELNKIGYFGVLCIFPSLAIK